MKLTTVEFPEKDMVRFTLCADAQEFETAIQQAYEATREKYAVPGFAKGEAGRAAIEAHRGFRVFWFDAINALLDAEAPALLAQAAAENALTLAGRPEYDLADASKETGFVVTADSALRPAVILKPCTGFTARRKIAAVTDAQVDAGVEQLRRGQQRSRVKNGFAEAGDAAVIDFAGTADGVPFAGGSAQNYRLQLGAGRMIPGFEEGILGHAAGEEFDVPVTFPVNYHEQSLAGRAAVFHITLHEVSQLLKPDDAQLCRVFGKPDMPALRQDIRNELQRRAAEQADLQVRDALFAQLADAAETEIPPILIRQRTDTELHRLEAEMNNRRSSLHEYLARSGMTKEQLRAQLEKASEREVRLQLAFTQLAGQEGFAVTEEELNAEMERRAAASRKPLSEYEKVSNREAVRIGMTRQRAAAYLMKHSTITEE